MCSGCRITAKRSISFHNAGVKLFRDNFLFSMSLKGLPFFLNQVKRDRETCQSPFDAVCGAFGSISIMNAVLIKRPKKFAVPPEGGTADIYQLIKTKINNVALPITRHGDDEQPVQPGPAGSVSLWQVRERQELPPTRPPHPLSGRGSRKRHCRTRET